MKEVGNPNGINVVANWHLIKVVTRVSSFPLHIKKPRSQDPRHPNHYDKCGEYWTGHKPLLSFTTEIHGEIFKDLWHSRGWSSSSQVKFTNFVGQTMTSRGREGRQQPRISYLTRSAISRAIRGACSKS